MWTAAWLAETDPSTAELGSELTEPLTIEQLIIWAAGADRRQRRLRAVAADRAVAAEQADIPDAEDAAARVGLVLYVSSTSPHSQRALDVLRGVLEQCEPGLVELTVLDLSDNPHVGADDKIAYTPTLVKVFPEPRAWVIGNLENPQAILDLLREYLVDTADGRGNGHENLLGPGASRRG